MRKQRDIHSDNFEDTRRQDDVLDQAMRAMMEDVQDQTLVVLGSEFGRTHRSNDNDGRGHRNRAFTCLLARLQS